MYNFVRLQAIESELELPQKFWGRRNSSAPYLAIYTQYASLLYLIIYTLYVNFCAILFIRNRDKLIPKNPEKM